MHYLKANVSCTFKKFNSNNKFMHLYIHSSSLQKTVPVTSNKTQHYLQDGGLEIMYTLKLFLSLSFTVQFPQTFLQNFIREHNFEADGHRWSCFLTPAIGFSLCALRRVWVFMVFHGLGRSGSCVSAGCAIPLPLPMQCWSVPTVNVHPPRPTRLTI